MEITYDFYRRVKGRLTVNKDRYNQIHKHYENTKCPVKKKVFEGRLKEIAWCISELEFVKSNIEEDLKG